VNILLFIDIEEHLNKNRYKLFYQCIILGQDIFRRKPNTCRKFKRTTITIISVNQKIK